MLGDPTISVLELWGAEYQESNALLVHAENRQTLQDICDREKVPVSFVGEITGIKAVVIQKQCRGLLHYLSMRPHTLPLPKNKLLY